MSDEQFDKIISKQGSSVTAGTKSAQELIDWMKAKAPLTAEQEAKVRALSPVAAPIEGEFMTDEEVAAARQRELDESQS